MQTLTETLSDWADGLVKRIRHNLQATGTNASGKTSESLEYEVDSDGVTIYGRPYFQGVEIGRPGGKVPRNFSGIILQWMQDKGIDGKFGDTDSQKRSAAYLIARKIANDGTRLWNSGGRTDIYSEAVDEALDDLGNKLRINLIEILEREP